MGGVSAICPDAPTIEGYFEEVTKGESGIMICAGQGYGYGYTDTARAIILVCSNSTWGSFYSTSTNITCKHDIGLGDDCGIFIPPAGTSELSTAYSNVKRLLCGEGEGWLSQAPFQIVQCIKGKWITPLDVCSDTGDFPRDCSFMAERELAVAGTARIAWSGDWRYEILSVKCDMSPNISESGWTLAMAYESGIFSYDEFFDGSFASTKYFLGTNRLSELTSYRPYTFKFGVLDINNIKFFTIYGSVVIDKASHSIKQLGGIHGNGGDPFSQYLGQPINCSPILCWWDSANTDPSEQMALPLGFQWPTIGPTGMPPKKIELYIRPEEFDLAYNCPPYLVTSPSWENHTSIFVSEKRFPGYEHSFECLGPLQYEVLENGTASREGNSICERVGGVLDWNRRLVLPCIIKPAPPPFVLSNQQDRYYYFSTSPVSSFFEASDRCNSMGASLATIDYIDNFNNSLLGTYYYAAHNMRASDLIEPPIPLDSVCVKRNACKWKDHTQCIGFNDLGEHMSASCYDYEYHYICMIPGYCPVGFTEVKGSCFKVLSFVGSPLQTYIACNGEYSGLMNPYNETIIHDLLENGVIERNVVYSTAIHTWENGLLDKLEPSFADQFLLSSDDQWFHFSIDDDYKINFISSPLDGDVLGTALCQYPADDVCLTDPEPALANMSLSVEGYFINEEATYTCATGSFVGGNTSLQEQTTKCIGQLGEWYRSIEQCIYVEVCFEIPSSPSELLTNSSDPTLRYLGDSIVFYCPENMSTPSGLSEQTFTCSYTSATEFGYLPSVIEDCTVCIGEPLVSNGTYALGTGPFTVGSKNVTVTCDAYHLFAVNITQMDLECTPEGWEPASCYEGCIEPPPLAGANMISEENTVASVGATLLYNCIVDDLYIQTPSVS